MFDCWIVFLEWNSILIFKTAKSRYFFNLTTLGKGVQKSPLNFPEKLEVNICNVTGWIFTTFAEPPPPLEWKKTKHFHFFNTNISAILTSITIVFQHLLHHFIQLTIYVENWLTLDWSCRWHRYFVIFQLFEFPPCHLYQCCVAYWYCTMLQNMLFLGSPSVFSNRLDTP